MVNLLYEPLRGLPLFWRFRLEAFALASGPHEPLTEQSTEHLCAALGHLTEH